MFEAQQHDFHHKSKNKCKHVVNQEKLNKW